MTFPIKTNQLKYEIDFKALDSKFDIFLVTTTDKYFKTGSKILDSQLLDGNICSIRFSYGNKFWILMKKQDENLLTLKNTLKLSDYAEKITIEKQNSSYVYIDTLLQLLLNSLGTFESKYLRMNNLTGHLYCFHPKWIKRNKNSNISRIMKVPCLEISVSQDLRLKMNVRTFSNIVLRNKMEFNFGKISFNEYPQYIMNGKNTLCRKLELNTGEDAFILKQTKNSRTEIPFLDIQNIERFNETKIGVLVNVLTEFNDKFSGIVKLELKDIDNYVSLNYTNSVSKENQNSIINALLKNPIKIVDCINDDSSEIFCKEIAQFFKEKYNIKVKFGKTVSENNYNIRVIHNKSYYEDDKDPHDEIFTNCSVQHITIEDMYDLRESALNTIVHEMLIKQDILNKEVTLYDWKQLNYKNSWTFGIMTDKKETKTSKYIFMTVSIDGKFEIYERELNLFEIDEYSDMVQIFDSKSKSNQKTIGIIKNDKGEINIIKETGWYSIPEIENLRQELIEGNTHLRNKEKREQLLSACLDIKYFINENSHYYFVGTIGNGMRTTINNSCNIRNISPYKNSTVFFKELLPLMNVSFVRNGRLTIIPFPFKYLREYENKYLKSKNEKRD